jgi:predicted nucleic acid-binding Zn ribbon protein
VSRPTDPAWRRAPGRERSTEATGISSVIEEMLGDASLAAGLAVGVLGREWVSVVGERLATETEPFGLDDRGALLIRASTAAWAAQVKFLSAGIAEAANRVLGRDGVRSVRVLVRGPTSP